jgi:hypothetical protein
MALEITNTVAPLRSMQADIVADQAADQVADSVADSMTDQEAESVAESVAESMAVSMAVLISLDILQSPVNGRANDSPGARNSGGSRNRKSSPFGAIHDGIGSSISSVGVSNTLSYVSHLDVSGLYDDFAGYQNRCVLSRYKST